MQWQQRNAGTKLIKSCSIKLPVLLSRRRHIEGSRELLQMWGCSWSSAKLAMAAPKCWNGADYQVQHQAARHPVSQVHLEGPSRITAHVRTIFAERLAHNGSSKCWSEADDQLQHGKRSRLFTAARRQCQPLPRRALQRERQSPHHDALIPVSEVKRIVTMETRPESRASGR